MLVKTLINQPVRWCLIPPIYGKFGDGLVYYCFTNITIYPTNRLRPLWRQIKLRSPDDLESVRNMPSEVLVLKQNMTLAATFFLCKLPKLDLGVSWNGGTPSHHPFIDGFSMKKSIQLLGIPHFWKPPFDKTWCHWMSGSLESFEEWMGNLMGSSWFFNVVSGIQ